VVSAPRKVLITGANLILEQSHAGLVLSTLARFYGIINLSTKISFTVPDISFAI
jgi:phosphomevalonate kinase